MCVCVCVFVRVFPSVSQPRLAKEFLEFHICAEQENSVEILIADIEDIEI